LELFLSVRGASAAVSLTGRPGDVHFCHTAIASAIPRLDHSDMDLFFLSVFVLLLFSQTVYTPKVSRVNLYREELKEERKRKFGTKATRITVGHGSRSFSAGHCCGHLDCTDIRST
jgi:hypothetical protein